MGYIDMHCDTLMMYAEPDNPRDLFQNDRQVDFLRLKEGGAMAQFFAIFLPHWEPGNPRAMPDEQYIQLLSHGLFHSIEQHSNLVRLARNAEEIQQNHQRGLLSAVLTMEDGRAVRGNLETLKRFYELGVRALALTWNYEHCFGYPNSPDFQQIEKGLKPFGKEAVVYMQEELGMLVDVSHLSDGGFYDVASLCKKPFIASHSNARALSPHPRNLTDDMLRVLGEKGGVTGINFFGAFLNEDVTDYRSTVDQMVRHARHIVNKAGLESLGFGSDFDGISGEQELTGCQKMPLLLDGLKKAGFHEKEIEQITHKNLLRVMKEAVR